MTAAAQDLVDRLATHRTLRGTPRVELEWLAAHGTLRRYETGDVAARKNEPVMELVILLSGRASSYVDTPTGRRHHMDYHAGDVSGLLPFSRLSGPPGDISIAEPTEVLLVHRDQFPEMIRECPTVIATLVHLMMDRARQMVSATSQDDKMASLGRLAAGLAHELNNPASAAARSAKLLADALTDAHQASRALGAARLTEAQLAQVDALSNRSLIPATTGVFSAIERSDREDDIVDWLEAHGADPGPANALGESGVTTDMLDELAESFADDTLDAVLRWVAAEYTARSLAGDVERATTRIHDLVSSVKRFTYVDRAVVAEPTNIAQGLTDTVAVLAGKARAKSVAVRLDVTPDVPPVPGNAGDLNQVWANLIENAIDAVGPSGEVTVTAAREDDHVAVRVVDNGPGIPPDVQGRMFDPFFTTKPMGQGTGLGLDIALRTVRGYDGQIAVDSRPGRTEFRVTLPVSSSHA